MEFALSDDQRMFQASVTAYLASVSGLDDVRKVADGDAGLAARMTSGLAELGAGQILIPADHGGLGLGLLDAALVQEALGASVSPAGHLAAAMSAVGIAAGASDAQAVEWLPRLATLEMRVGVAVAERVGARAGSGIDSNTGTLSGKSLFALDTRDATHILVCDRTGGLHLVEADAAGLGRVPLATVDRTRDFAALTFDAVAAISLNGQNDHGRAADRMIAAGRILLAADTLGAAQAMLDRAVAYAKERKQFNRVIGSFQAVKHMCAEMVAELEPSRALVWHAAHAMDESMDEAEVMVCLAKAHLAEVGTFVARTATEVHGGMGFTDLVGLHYWFKRIGANRQLLGGPERAREEAARMQGWV